MSTAAALLGVLVLTAHAAEPAKADPKPDAKKEARPAKRTPLTEEQKAVRKEILAKYDTNKDGKLDATERKSMTKEDRQKLRNVPAEAAKGKKKAK